MKIILDFLHNTKVQAFGFYIVMVGGFLLVWKGALPENDRNRLFDLMFLTATFYYGSSKSGTAKDDTIANLAQNKSATADTNTGDITVKQ